MVLQIQNATGDATDDGQRCVAAAMDGRLVQASPSASVRANYKQNFNNMCIAPYDHLFQVLVPPDSRIPMRRPDGRNGA